MSELDTPGEITLERLARCYTGGIPAVLCTASVDGVPNVTYISRIHQIDGDRIALSNQFLSKSSRNLAVNPVADLLVMDPVSHDEFRLTIRYERTERRGILFERLRTDIESLAALTGMQDVFRLRAADIFRVIELEQIPPNPATDGRADLHRSADPTRALQAFAGFAAWIDRATDLDVLLDTALEGLDRLLGYRHTTVLLVDESGQRLFSIASHGFDDENVGAEIQFGEGQIGFAAAQCTVQHVTGLRQLRKYSRSIRLAADEAGVRPGREVPMPGLPNVDSRIIVPILALGQLTGLLVAERPDPAAFDAGDEQILSLVCSVLGNAIEHARAIDVGADPVLAVPVHRSAATIEPVATSDAESVIASSAAAPAVGSTHHLRYFEVDGSVFLDDEYLIKGVAGRIMRRLVSEHIARGRTEFTNRELRLDPTLDLPGFKDNLESRLILLKRRLDERSAPVRIEKTGRGRFRIAVLGDLDLEIAAAD